MQWNGHEITVKQRWPEGWQRYIASCEGISGNDGPNGFGLTEQSAIEDLMKQFTDNHQS